MLKKLFQQPHSVSLEDSFSSFAQQAPLNSAKGRRNHRSDRLSLYLGVQPVFSVSMEQFVCSIAFLEKKAKVSPKNKRPIKMIL